MTGNDWKQRHDDKADKDVDHPLFIEVVAEFADVIGLAFRESRAFRLAERAVVAAQRRIDATREDDR